MGQSWLGLMAGLAGKGRFLHGLSGPINLTTEAAKLLGLRQVSRRERELPNALRMDGVRYAATAFLCAASGCSKKSR